jgi:hypothetical protein
METPFDLDSAVQNPTGNTPTVLVFLAAFAIIISWLVCYALPPVLVSADLMSAWPSGTDPRPQWMLRAFTGVFGGFAVLGLVFRWTSNRQLRRIDAMADE